MMTKSRALSVLFIMCIGLLWADMAGAASPTLKQCQSDLNTCNSNLQICSTDKNTLSSNLNTCNNNLQTCATDKNICSSDLNTCNNDLAACQAAVAQSFPGDGAGDGPTLDYVDNNDGTFTDTTTLFTWEKKLAADGSQGGNCNLSSRSVHCVNNTYVWSGTGSAADGALFTVFLNTLNNTCSDETTTCKSDTDCTGIGNGKCGFAGHRDWCIPNVKKLQSIVDYSKLNPATSFPGTTALTSYWSATTIVTNSNYAWLIDLSIGSVSNAFKGGGFPARAVRPCP